MTKVDGDNLCPMTSPEGTYRDTPEAEQAYITQLEAENAQLREELARRGVVLTHAQADTVLDVIDEAQRGVTLIGQNTETMLGVIQGIKDLQRQVELRGLANDTIAVLVWILGCLAIMLWRMT